MSIDRAFLEIESLDIGLGKFSLKNVTLSCGKGEYHVLLGPTGSGKSTLLKCILGFLKIQNGRIRLDGNNITEVPPEHRRMGYVPQNYALFPHLSVEENLRFGIRAGEVTNDRAGSTVDGLCEMLGIDHLRGREVHNLSGGEKQKVAIGRALAIRPELLLLDEPFSSIDEGARRNLWFELKRIVEQGGFTTLHVTHNLEEAYILGEHLSVLIDGNLVQSGHKQDIFERPASESIARYLNYRNIFRGRTKSHPEGTLVETEHFDVVLKRKLPLNEQVGLCVRAQDIKIIKEGVPIKDSLKRNVFTGKIVDLFPLTDYCLMWFKVDGSGREFDFEVKFPRYLKERYDLYTGRSLRVALWEPTIILL